VRSWVGSYGAIVAGIVFVASVACGPNANAPARDAATVVSTGGTQPGDGGALATGGQVGTGGAGAAPDIGDGPAGGAGGGDAGGGAGSGGATGATTNSGLGGAIGAGGLDGLGGTYVASGGRSGGGTAGAGGAGTSGGQSGDGRGDGGAVAIGGASATGGAHDAGGVMATGGGGGISVGGGAGASVWPGKFVGNIDTRSSIQADFARYWNQLSPENAGKWGVVQASSATTFRWDTLDAMYQYCQDHGIVFKEHSFIWGASQPGWMGALDTTTGPAAVKGWMKAFCERYPNTRLIDVVNEPPPHTTPTYTNAIGGGTNTTWDWVANSFTWAREACPGAVLILNDYNNIESDTDLQRTLDIVTAIRKLGAPIDAIGCQTHNPKTFAASTLKENIDKIVAATGLPVYITEYDIAVSDDEEQRRLYADHITMFWNHPDVKGITLWGFISGATWLSNSGIMSADGTMRPAMTWLMDFLGR
jgi:endo-1,4-beta-xylanase